MQTLPNIPQKQPKETSFLHSPERPPEVPPITQDEFAKVWWSTIVAKGEIAGLLRQLERVEGFVFYGFILLVFTVVGMGFAVFAIFSDYLANKQSSYAQLNENIWRIENTIRLQCPIYEPR